MSFPTKMCNDVIANRSNNAHFSSYFRRRRRNVFREITLDVTLHAAVGVVT